MSKGEEVTNEGERYPCYVYDVNDVKGFSSIGVPDMISKHLATLKINNPTPIQVAMIPRIVEQVPSVVIAPTGSGKTACYAIPILMDFIQDPYGIMAVVIEPTRELALQVNDQFLAFGTPFGLRTACCIGGVGVSSSNVDVRARPCSVVGTPGRLRYILETNENLFEHAAYLVIDEADMLIEDSTMWEDVAAIIQILRRNNPKLLQILVTATLTSELEDALLEKGSCVCRTEATEIIVRGESSGKGPTGRGKLGSYEENIVSNDIIKGNGLYSISSDTSLKFLLCYHPERKYMFLLYFLELVGIQFETKIKDALINVVFDDGRDDYSGEKVKKTKKNEPESTTKNKNKSIEKTYKAYFNQSILFCETIEQCQTLTHFLKKLEVSFVTLHSGMDQYERTENIRKFRSRFVALLVTTDACSRGLDIPSVDNVIMMAPCNPTTFVHRAGRIRNSIKGKVEHKGMVLCLSTKQELKLVSNIESTLKRNMDKMDINEKQIASKYLALSLKAERYAIKCIEEENIQKIL